MKIKFAAIIALCWLILASPVRAQIYSVTEIGTLPGGTFSLANGINNSGVIVGQADNGSTNDAFSLSGGVMTDLGFPAGHGSAEALGVNDSGQIVGISTGGDSFSYTSAGGYVDLGNLGTAGGGSANAVNSLGVVVGASKLPSTVEHAYSWTSAGGMVDLGAPPGSTFSAAFGVNDSNQIVGDYHDTSGNNKVFSYTSAGGMVDIGTLGGSQSNVNVGGDGAKVINNSGEVVGDSRTTGDAATHAFSWTSAGGMIDLGTLGGTNSQAIAINSSGQIVGEASISGPFNDHAFIYSGGVMVDLNSELDASGAGWTLEYADGINDSGEIIGSGLNPSDQFVSFLLAPIPEPGSTVMLVGGLGLLAVVLRHRKLHAERGA